MGFMMEKLLLEQVHFQKFGFTLSLTLQQCSFIHRPLYIILTTDSVVI